MGAGGKKKGLLAKLEKFTFFLNILQTNIVDKLHYLNQRHIEKSQNFIMLLLNIFIYFFIHSRYFPLQSIDPI